MIQLCSGFSFLFLWIILFSFVSTQYLVGYINTAGGFCIINPVTGSYSNCFTIPNTQLLPTNSCVVFNNILYVLSQNFSLPETPYRLLAINLSQRNLIWAVSVPPYGSPPFSRIFGLVGYSAPDSSLLVMVWATDYSNAQYYLVSLQGNITPLFRNLYDKPQVGTFDTQLQRMWMLVPQFQKNIYYYNLRDKTFSRLPNPFNIITLAYNPYHHLFYGLAQAAQSVLLYSWAWDYPNSLTLVGFVPNVQLNLWGTTNLNPPGTVLTFISKSNQFVSISVQDASVISISGPLAYRLYAWEYLEF